MMMQGEATDGRNVFMSEDFRDIPAKLRATTISGYIIKQGQNFKTNRRRFFVLEGYIYISYIFNMFEYSLTLFPLFSLYCLYRRVAEVLQTANQGNWQGRGLERTDWNLWSLYNRSGRQEVYLEIAHRKRRQRAGI